MTRRRSAGWIVCAMLSSTACTPSSHPASQPDPASRAPTTSAAERDAAVYAAVIDTLFTSRDTFPQRRIVLVETTQLSRRATFIEEFWGYLYTTTGSDSTAVAELESRGRVKLALRPIVPAIAARTNVPIEMVAESTLVALPRTGPPRERFMGPSEYYWDAFYKMFPRSQGTVSFSAVGYSRSGDRAVLFVNHSCHSLCGEGHVVTLRRDGEGWLVVTLRMTWIS